jgi:hypothetical protein
MIVQKTILCLLSLKRLLDQMVEDSGVDLLYHTFLSDTVLENGTVSGVVVQNKNGRGLIRAKRIIDCTGDGDVAAFAGCGVEVGRLSDHKCQPVTLMFTIGGVDWRKVLAWRTDYKMTSAALSFSQNISPRKLNTDILQKTLCAKGAILDDADIDAAAQIDRGASWNR